MARNHDGGGAHDDRGAHDDDDVDEHCFDDEKDSNTYSTINWTTHVAVAALMWMLSSSLCSFLDSISGAWIQSTAKKQARYFNIFFVKTCKYMIE